MVGNHDGSKKTVKMVPTGMLVDTGKNERSKAGTVAWTYLVNLANKLMIPPANPELSGN